MNIYIISKAYKYLGLLAKYIWQIANLSEPKNSLYNSCQIPINMLLQIVELIPDQRHCYLRKNPETSHQIYSERF